MIDSGFVTSDPGCYLFKDDLNNVIYIGKAKNLKKRVKSYFQKNDLDAKTKSLIENIGSVDVIVTDTDVEALILENNLIKKHQPKYNIDLKDSKNYAYIQLTQEAYPRLQIARKKIGKGSFFGPFVSAQERDHVLYVVNKTFKLRKCRRMPKKPCLRSHINLCCTPCTGEIDEDDYKRLVEKAKLTLKGRSKELIRALENEMTHTSDNLNFERAIEIRDQIESLKNLSERQNVDRQRRHDETIINFIVRKGVVYLLMFNIYTGTLNDKEEFSFDLSPDFFEEFLVQYYSENVVPKELILPRKVDESVIEFLEVKRKGGVIITVPKKGGKKQLLELVKKNAEITFFGDLSKLEELRDSLGLTDTPYVIESFDVSHLSGTSTVGSMVQFRNAKPDKSNYRRFKIKTVEGISDTAAIAEIVRRRSYKLKKEESELPNLIIIDGGVGQLNSALKSLQNLDLRIPVISIAKRFDDIYIPGRVLPIKLDKSDKALRFIQEIRDEAHRFAIKYQRLLRSKKLIE
jgi:excinuclease ABC subunit C